MQPFESQPGNSPPATNAPEPSGLTDAVNRTFQPNGAPAIGRPDPYRDEKRILEFVNECKREALDLRWVYERGWWRNILYVLGRQWIYYDRKKGWVDKRFARWIPRPVTNKMAESLEAIRATFASVQLSTVVRPSGEAADSIATAQTADLLEPVIQAEHKILKRFNTGDFWLIATGNFFVHPWWNPDAVATLKQYDLCTRCGAVVPPDEKVGTFGACPKCNGTVFIEAKDELGPIGELVYQGGGETDICSPLEIAMPPSYENLDQCPYLVRLRWRAKRWTEDNYDAALYKKLSWQKFPHERTLQLAKSIATQSDIAATPLYAVGGGEQGGGEGLPEIEVWARPCKQYPEGLVARVLGDGQPILVHAREQGIPGPLPFRTRRGTPLFPWVQCGYEEFGGRIWFRSPLDRVVQKQDQLNQLDSFMDLAANRTSNPVWLEPRGAEVKSFTGEPGLVIRYNPLAAAGSAKPERIPGENIPASLTQRRQQLLKDIEDLLGTYDIIKGQKPTGVEAFSALNLLVERSQSRFAPVLSNRGEAYRQWYGLALELERQFGPTERVWPVMRPNRSWTFKKFKNANLTGAIDILIEDGSTAPKTSLGKRAAIEHANQLGILDKNDAEQRFQLYQELGLTRLAPSLDAAVKSALQEQDEFEQWAARLAPARPAGPDLLGATPLSEPSRPGGPLPPARPLSLPAAGPPGPPPMPGALPAQPGAGAAGALLPAPPLPVTPLRRKPWHNDPIHLAEHVKWMNSDEVRELLKMHPDFEMIFGAHLAEHEGAIAAKQAAQAMAAAGPGAAPPQGGALAMERSNRLSPSTQNEPRGAGEGAQQAGPR